jgi:hypothetical protein
MPFSSKAQARFLFAKHLTIAKEFATHTGSMKNLPEHAKRRKQIERRMKPKE